MPLHIGTAPNCAKSTFSGWEIYAERSLKASCSCSINLKWILLRSGWPVLKPSCAGKHPSSAFSRLTTSSFG